MKKVFLTLATLFLFSKNCFADVVYEPSLKYQYDYSNYDVLSMLLVEAVVFIIIIVAIIILMNTKNKKK